MADDKQLTDEEKAQAMIRAIFEDGEAEINGRVYKFTTMTHKQRRKVFAFLTRVAPAVDQKNLSFIDDPSFEPVEQIIHKAVTFDDSLLSVLGDSHWEKYPGDYITFTTVALQVISYPFTVADRTG